MLFLGDCFHGGSLNASNDLISHRRLHGYLTIGRHAINSQAHTNQGWASFNVDKNRNEASKEERKSGRKRRRKNY